VETNSERLSYLPKVTQIESRGAESRTLLLQENCPPPGTSPPTPSQPLSGVCLDTVLLTPGHTAPSGQVWGRSSECSQHPAHSARARSLLWLCLAQAFPPHGRAGRSSPYSPVPSNHPTVQSGVISPKAPLGLVLFDPISQGNQCIIPLIPHLFSGGRDSQEALGLRRARTGLCGWAQCLIRALERSGFGSCRLERCSLCRVKGPRPRLLPEHWFLLTSKAWEHSGTGGRQPLGVAQLPSNHRGRQDPHLGP
jgi:hypothetical protein